MVTRENIWEICRAIKTEYVSLQQIQFNFAIEKNFEMVRSNCICLISISQSRDMSLRKIHTGGVEEE